MSESPFGVEHGYEVSKKLPGGAVEAVGNVLRGGKLKGVLKPYSGGNMRAANALKAYKGGVPAKRADAALGNRLRGTGAR